MSLVVLFEVCASEKSSPSSDPLRARRVEKNRAMVCLKEVYE